MNNDCKYSPDDKMSYLISDNFQILMVMSRFNITLGFGAASRADSRPTASRSSASPP